MSNLRTAAQQALEVLEAGTDVDPIFAGETEAALRAALAQQDEPRNQCGETCERAKLCATCAQALAQKPEPLNLADPAVQKRLAAQWGYVPAAQAEPVEPVAWMYDCGGGGRMYAEVLDGVPGWTPLYTAPPQRKPLTEKEIESCRQQGYAHAGLSAPFDFGKAARAVERALEEKNCGR